MMGATHMFFYSVVVFTQEKHMFFYSVVVFTQEKHMFFYSVVVPWVNTTTE
jgi:hypothetical protein